MVQEQFETTELPGQWMAQLHWSKWYENVQDKVLLSTHIHICTFITIIYLCDPLWENQTSPVQYQNEMEARKTEAIITAVGHQIFFH